MEYKNDVQEFAYLMHETKYSYHEIYCYSRAQDAYFTTLDDEEAANEDIMFEFIQQHTNLSNEQIKKIGKAQLKFNVDVITDEQEIAMVKEMVDSFTKEDRENMNEDFYSIVLDYSNWF